MKKLIALLVIGGMFIFVSMECALTKNTQSIVNSKKTLSKIKQASTKTEQRPTIITKKQQITSQPKEEVLGNNFAD